MHKTHARLVTLMIVRVTEVAENKKEIPVAKSRLIMFQKLLRRYIKHYHGELVEVSFGEVYAYFPGANLAYKAAVNLPRLMPKFNLRTGLHLGELLFRQEKPQGSGLNFASRLPALARAGGVCLSPSVYQYLKPRKQAGLVTLGLHDLKNINSQTALYAYLPKGQMSRRKKRDFFRRLKTALSRYSRPLIFLAVVFLPVIFLLLMFKSFEFKVPELAGNAVLEVYMPAFETTSPSRITSSQLAAIDMTVRANIVASNSDSATTLISLVTTQHDQGIRLLVSVKLAGDQLSAEYRILYSGHDGMLTSGQVVGDAAQIFQFEDRLSSLILADIRKYNEFASGLESDSVRATLVGNVSR